MTATRPRLTEKQFSQRIVDYARLRGWRVYRTWNSIHSPAGFPDLFMVRWGRVLAVELKVRKNEPTEAQQQWLADLDEVPGIAAYCFWPDGEDELFRLLDGEGLSLEPVRHVVPRVAGDGAAEGDAR